MAFAILRPLECCWVLLRCLAVWGELNSARIGSVRVAAGRDGADGAEDSGGSDGADMRLRVPELLPAVPSLPSP